MTERQYLTPQISARLDEMLRWYDTVGKFLQQPERPGEPLPHAIGPGRIKGLTTASVSSTDDTFTIDNVEVIVGKNPTATSTGTVTIQNRHGWDADDNALCRAELVPTSTDPEKWESYQMTCAS